MSVKDVHSWGLREASTITSYFLESHVGPLEVIKVLNRAEVKFVLVGAYGLSGWMKEPRATADVDVVVMNKHVRKATAALTVAFPHLEAEDHEVVVRLRERDTGVVRIDVMKQCALYREALRHTKTVHEGKTSYRIPSLEMALTMKFAAMLSPNRAEEDRHQDAHDFINIVKHNPDIDAVKLQALGELAFAGGGQRLLGLVEDVRAGRKLVL